MINGLCHTGAMGFLGNSGVFGGAGMLLHIFVWLVAIVGFTLLVVWALRQAKSTAAKTPQAMGQPSTSEILQAQYAGGEISQVQNEIRKEDIG